MRIGACSLFFFSFSGAAAEAEAAVLRRRVAVGAVAASRAAAEAEVAVSSSLAVTAAAAGDFSSPPSAPRPILLPPDEPSALIFAVALLTRMLRIPARCAGDEGEK